MRQKGLMLKTGITQKEQQVTEDEIRRMDPTITAAEAHGGVFALSDPITRSKIYGGKFSQSLLQDLDETSIRINNEGKLILEKHIDNTQRYTQNINSRIAQGSMNLGSYQPVITPEQQRNELMNEGSPRQKQILSRYLNDEFANQEQATDLGQSSFVDDVQPETSLAQEKLSEAQRQKIEVDIISSVNLNTVYDIGALDWDRPRINYIYGRQPFETQQAGYKYDQFCTPVAYLKKPTLHIEGNYDEVLMQQTQRYIR
ncbi:MAG: hypothetical protein EZS28_038951 [Streblomastix strix]|uniref:Uncharacterized protein n=1 Tax=Streblomastix strix TaxID=222440 RepID=A0A5J4U6E9_9EUKA|nr:MAG: hypothetical protein EZS28_038951 [Streblomastix strix]